VQIAFGGVPMRTRPWQVASLVVTALVFGSCFTYRRVGQPPAEVLAKNPGDIRVTLADGKRIALRKPHLEGDSLVGTRIILSAAERHDPDVIAMGPRVAVALANVKSMEVSRFNAGATLLATAGFAALVVAVAAAISLQNLGGFGGGSGNGGGDYYGSCPTAYVGTGVTGNVTLVPSAAPSPRRSLEPTSIS
jgi:hypothetical protein